MCKVHITMLGSMLYPVGGGYSQNAIQGCTQLSPHSRPLPPPTHPPIILRMHVPKLDFFFFESRAILKIVGPIWRKWKTKLHQIFSQFFSFLKFHQSANFFAENPHITCQKTCFSKCLRGRKGIWQSNLREW